MLALLLLAVALAPAIADFECGVTNSDPTGSARIVGGQPESYFKFPWYAALHKSDKIDHLECAGALIAPQFVMTAAHCFDGHSVRAPLKDWYHVTLGIFNKCKDTPGAKTYKTSDVFVHPNYVKVDTFFDIALMKLDGVSELMPVCLPPQGAPIEYVDNAIIAGFGRLSYENSEQPCEINEATVEIFTNHECKYKSKYFSNVKNALGEQTLAFCAGKLAGETDSCQGDSGGSIIVKKDNRYIAKGIVSYGMGCAKEGYPGIYTNVAYFIDFINNTMEGVHDVHYPTPKPVHNPPKPIGCGAVNEDQIGLPRVIGGEAQTFFKFPWFASIHKPNQKDHQECAGTLIQPYFVMTAASCFDEDLGIPLEDYFQVTLGTFSQCEETLGELTYKIAKVLIHPEYVKTEVFHDIALMKLDGPSELTPACVTGRGPIRHVRNATIVGFGAREEDDDDQPCEINEAYVEIYTNQECHDQSALPRDITNKMLKTQNAFCAGKMTGGKDVCKEDKGGSILTLEYSRYFAKGIVSSGYGCGKAGMPSIYTNVGSYWKWLQSGMSGAYGKMDAKGKMDSKGKMDAKRKMDTKDKMKQPKSKKKPSL